MFTAMIKGATVLTFLVLGSAVQANQWNLTKSFTTQYGNPHGPWRYGASITNATPLFVYRDSTQNMWSDSALNQSDPLLGILTPSVYRSGSQVFIKPLPIGYQVNGNWSVVEFTMPATGTYRMWGMFGAGEPGAVDVEITSSVRADLFVRRGLGGDASFDFITAGLLGERIRFSAGASASLPNSHLSGTPLDLNILLIPVAPPAPWIRG
ncbi:MAG TPA: hypothetical protein PKA27_09125 [Fimbriimonadaceae bacterium]|nr:hypothetical protein [Fimbriimonadaceae bacterium]